MVSPTDEKEKLDQQNIEESSTSEDTEIEDENSSDSETSEKDPSTFDVVMKAIDEDGDEEDESSEEKDDSEESKEEPESEDEGKTEDDKDESDEPSDEELKQWKPKTRKRFKDLQSKHRVVIEERDTLKGQLEEANVDAGNYKRFVGFLEENRLSGEEADKLFNIGALMKNDPVRALEEITPYVNQLLEVTGNILPDDLKQQVEQGVLPREHAIEISRSRMTSKTNQNIEEERQQHKQEADNARQKEQVESMQGAIANWEKQWAVSDPDYAKKKDRVLERVELTLVRAQRAGNLPNSVEQAVEMANKIKNEVDAEFKKFAQKRPVNTVDGGGSTQSLPEPKDTRDVIRRALHK